MIAPQSNLMLDAVLPESRDLILSQAKEMPLPLRTRLFEPEEHPKYAYFLTSGFASVVIELAEGGSAEVALIGREGMVGGLNLLGPATATAQCFIQMEAGGYRVPFSYMKKLFHECEDVRQRVLENVQQQGLTTSQLSACNKLHEAEPRLARWLLMVQDRIQSDTLHITQEFLAQMLGTQRTTVVMVAGALQRRGLIEYSRGKVRIVSRENLEQAACDCYKVTQRLLMGLYTEAV